MKPVRRNIRRHFGLTAKQVAVRSQRPWYFRLVLAAVCVGFGFGLAYWLLHDNESESIKSQLQLTTLINQLQQTTLNNKELEVKVVEVQRKLQIELATNNNLAKELASVQDENIKIKEDLFFYKNMVGRKLK